MEKLIYNHTALADLLDKYDQLKQMYEPEEISAPDEYDILGDFLWDASGEIEQFEIQSEKLGIEGVSPEVILGVFTAWATSKRMADHLFLEGDALKLKTKLEHLMGKYKDEFICSLLAEYDFDLNTWIASLKSLENDELYQEVEMYLLEKMLLEDIDQLDLVIATIKICLSQSKISLSEDQLNHLKFLEKCSVTANKYIAKKHQEFIDTKKWVIAKCKSITTASHDLAPEFLTTLSKYEILVKSAIRQLEDLFGTQTDTTTLQIDNFANLIKKNLPN